MRPQGPALTIAAAIVIVAGAGAPAAAAVPPRQVAGTTMTAAALVTLIGTGAPVEFGGLDVTAGPLDLTSLKTIAQPLRCHDCRIDGGIKARDVTFARQVDLDGVDIAGPVDLRGAAFESSVLARASSTRGTVDGAIDVSFAFFGGTVSFDGLRFGGSFTAEGTTFGDDVSFTGSSFAGDAEFDRARFRANAAFGGRTDASVVAAFGGRVGFVGATFAGTADFGSRVFSGGIDLTDVSAEHTLSLAGAQIRGIDGLVADRARVDDLDASRAAVKGKVSMFSLQARVLSLESTTFGCSLDLQQAVVTARAVLRHIRVPAHTASTATCVRPGEVLAAGLTAGQLSMDRALVGTVAGLDNQRALLVQIEAFERQFGTSTDANAAHYDLLSIDARKKSGLDAVIDLSYRVFGGYLVRPSHPITTFVALVLLFTAIRLAHDIEQRRRNTLPASRPKPPPGLDPGLRFVSRFVVRAGHAIAVFLNALVRAFGAAVAPKPKIAAPSEVDSPLPYLVAAGLLVEYVVSKIVILTFLICLANYNTTLHDLVKGLIP